MKKVFLSLLAIAIGLTTIVTAEAQTVDSSKYIKLSLKASVDSIALDMSALADGTHIKIVSGSENSTITVGNLWIGKKKYKVAADTMVIYGGIKQFDCNENGESIVGIDVSHCTELTELYCDKNNIDSLDITKNEKLSILHCFDNNIASLDLSKNTKLSRFSCYRNRLTSLDVSHCAELTFLSCHSNTLTSLDVTHNPLLQILNFRSNRITSIDLSHNTELEWLYCNENLLTSLDIAHNRQINAIYCYGNKLSTQALDDLYCQLPDRNGLDVGKLQLLLDPSSQKDTVLATNNQNAFDRNWRLQYYKDGTSIPDTHGTYTCPSSGVEIAQAELSFYPNPVDNILRVAADKIVKNITIYNVYGIEVARAYNTDRIDISHLPSGVYLVRADDTTKRIVKK